MVRLRIRNRPVKRYYSRRYLAAKTIQKKWRSRNANIKKVVRNMAPTRGDVFFPVASLQQTPVVINNLSNITYNDDASVYPSRQSLKIKLMSFNFRGDVEMPTGVNSIYKAKVRLIVVRKKIQDQLPFDARKCFYKHPGAAITNYHQYQIDKRYCTAVWDNTFQLQNPDQSQLATGEATATFPVLKNFDLHLGLKGDKVTRFAETPNATNVQPLNNQFYLIGMSDHTGVGHPVIGGTAVVWFKNIM